VVSLRDIDERIAMKPKNAFVVSLVTFALAICILIVLLNLHGIGGMELIVYLGSAFLVFAIVSWFTAVYSALTILAARWFLIPTTPLAVIAAYVLGKMLLGGGGPGPGD